NARFLARPLLDSSANYRANPAESRLAGFDVRAGGYELAVFFLRAFRDDDDREFFADGLAFLNFSADAFVGEGNLWNQNHIRASRHTSKEGDPASVTPHHLQNHHAIVTFSSGMQPIEPIGRAGDGGIKSECEQRSFQIVVDRLGDAYYWNAVFKQLLRDAQRAVAADGDECK